MRRCESKVSLRLASRVLITSRAFNSVDYQHAASGGTFRFGRARSPFGIVHQQAKSRGPVSPRLEPRHVWSISWPSVSSYGLLGSSSFDEPRSSSHADGSRRSAVAHEHLAHHAPSPPCSTGSNVGTAFLGAGARCPNAYSDALEEVLERHEPIERASGAGGEGGSAGAVVVALLRIFDPPYTQPLPRASSTLYHPYLTFAPPLSGLRPPLCVHPWLLPFSSPPLRLSASPSRKKNTYTSRSSPS
jgi:hypothetical protein